MARVSAENNEGVFRVQVWCIILFMATASLDDDFEAGVFRETRDSPPAHYLLKLESFSLLAENGIDKIISKNFQAGDHQWKMVLFPKGNNGGKGNYVSVYLMLDSTAAGKVVNAFFKFFLFDQLRGKYHTVQGRVMRFDGIKNEWGVAKFISLNDLKVPTKGFLVDDTCLVGAEVFVIEGTSVRENLSISKVGNISGKYKWKINKFSDLGEDLYSEEFVVGGYKWKLWLFPKGNKQCKDCHLSLYLLSVDSQSSATNYKVKAEYKLTLKDQLNQKHKQNKATIWFGASPQSWGWPAFVEIKDVKDDRKGYIVSDRCIIEAEITVLYETSRKILE